MKKIITTLFLSIVMTSIYSQTTFTFDGIRYNTTSSSTVEVSGGGTGSVIIPSLVTYNSASYSVTSIKDFAFYSNTGLTSIILPNSITLIDSMAFYGCSGLKSLDIPSSVTHLYISALWSCSGLNSLTVSSNNNYYTCENGVLFDKAKINLLYSIPSITANYIIPSTVTNIGTNAFGGCVGLSSITIPSSVVSIGYCAFSNCTALASITIPTSVSTVGAYAFEGTAWYKNQPDGLIYINKILYIYKGTMPSGTSIVVNNGTTTINNYALSNCSGLISITIPSSVTEIGSSAFSNCTGLTSIAIPSSITSIRSYTFYSCSGLSTITIPSSVTSFGYSAFEGTAWYNNHSNGLIYINNILLGYKGFMPSNTSIVINDGTSSINDIAFQFCTGLISINIPSSVNFIGSNAFYDCSGLTSVIVNSINPPVLGSNSYTFYNVSKTIAVYVPVSGIDLYKNADGWKDFTNILGITTHVNNPVESNYSISINNREIDISNVINKHIMVYDISGRKVFEKSNAENNEKISLDNQGTYIISIENYRKKVIIH